MLKSRIHFIYILVSALLCFVMLSCTAMGYRLTPTFTPTLTATAIFTFTDANLATATDTRTPTMTITNIPSMPFIGTSTPSNAEMLALLAKTRQPTPMPIAPLNETGIIPGQTTQDQVIALAGQPWTTHGAVWRFNSVKLPDLGSVQFSRGVVRELDIKISNMSAESAILQYGPPEFVAHFIITEASSSVPVTAAPLPPAHGYLVYASRGMQFHFFCPNFATSCSGILKETLITNKNYFVPTTMANWLMNQPFSGLGLYLRPWTGFSD